LNVTKVCASSTLLQSPYTRSRHCLSCLILPGCRPHLLSQRWRSKSVAPLPVGPGSARIIVMSEIAAAASSFDEHVLQRPQSTGSIPNPHLSMDSPRRSLSYAHRQTELQSIQASRRSIRGVPSQRGQSLRLNTPNTASSPIAVPEAARSPARSPPLPWNTMSRTNSTTQADARAQDIRRPNNEPHSLGLNILELIGYSGANAKARRELLSLIWNLGFGVAQFVIVITLLAYSAHHESPTQPGLSEWAACGRPLGVWDSLWLVRVALGCLLSYWGWRREKAVRAIQESRQRGEDIESPRSPISGRPFPPDRPPPRPMRPPGAATIGQNATEPASPPAVTLPHSILYSRLSLLGTFMSLAWFLTAHILEYTSVNDCRFTSPHLWWLTFGILCILYVMILEIFLLGLLVFVFGPVIYLLWNIVLLCLGRHPLQNPHYIKPEIGKLPKSVVDQIPLVLYIPPPPDEPVSSNGGKPVPIPSPSYSYPPKRKTSAAAPKRRFAFMRIRKNKVNNMSGLGSLNEKNAGPSGKRGRGDVDPEKATWEDRWESSEYPFVRLEGNRAVCAICLLDFEEPKRVGGIDEAETKPNDHIIASPTGDGTSQPASPGDKEGDSPDSLQPVQEVQVEEVTQEERDRLKLDDAGEGAQPLRLLGCGHVFHQVCVDPWLIDVSGRCPTCQRPVELPNSQGKKSKRDRRTTP